MNHSLLPQPDQIRNAHLPVAYQNATLALAECSKVDECKEWEDKAQALASYAKQSENRELEKMAMRIRARAGERCGALLAEFEKKINRHSRSSSKDGLTRDEAAKDAGLSPKQAQTRLRVHDAKKNDPEGFENQLESDEPPTITSLAEQGMAKGIPRYEQLGMTKKAFQAGMYFQGRLADMAKQIKDFDPQDVVDGSTPEERKQIRKHIETIDKYFDQLIAKLCTQKN